MRYAMFLLGIVGIVLSALALREHYRTDSSPCSINEKWDCGIVNKSSYASLLGIPVADIGIAGYLLMAILAWRRNYRLLLLSAVFGLSFSLYLAHVEADILGVWCIYCVASLGIVSLLTLTALTGVIVDRRTRSVAP